MEAIDIYLMYCALKAHFSNSDYDYFKYGGKTRISRKSFFKRKDRFFFVKLSTKYKKYVDIRNYLVSNFIKVRNGYIANFTDTNFKLWNDRRNNFYNIFSIELHPLVSEFEPLFKIEGYNHPKLLQEYLGQRVSLETLIILNTLLNFSDEWTKKLSGDFIWNDTKKLMESYKGFLTIDVKRYKIQLLKLIEETS